MNSYAGVASKIESILELMSQIFYCLEYHFYSPGRAEANHSELEKLTAQYGEMEPWKRMHRVPGVPQPILLGGSRVNDITWSWYSQCIITDRLLNLLKEQEFTGFQVHPVSAKWKRKPKSENVEIPVLWELIPTGWGGVAPVESGIHRTETSLAKGHLRYTWFTDSSKLIDENQWDGSDFFILWPMPAYIFITDRVARFIQANNIKKAEMIRLDKMTHPVYVESMSPELRVYGPGPLRWYLTDERAREIGESLGIY